MLSAIRAISMRGSNCGGVFCSAIALAALVGISLPASAQTSELAQTLDTQASATIVTPISITSAKPMEFGTVTRPAADVCVYTLSPAGSLETSAGRGCQALSGTPLSAEFEVSCAPDQLARFDLTYANNAPDGALFDAGDSPVSIDGRGAGGLLQILPCDADGITIVRAGGRLTVTSLLAGEFSGQIGTIRLEAIYD